MALPPEPVLVNKVLPGTWAQQVGFQGGEEILVVNHEEVHDMDAEAFKAALKLRPLLLRPGAVHEMVGARAI